MDNNLHNELRKEFQLERLILFGNAVFAIVITFLVIEIKIPEIHEPVSDKALLQSLGHLVFLAMLPVAYLTNVIFAAHVPMRLPVNLRILKKENSENK